MGICGWYSSRGTVTIFPSITTVVDETTGGIVVAGIVFGFGAVVLEHAAAESASPRAEIAPITFRRLGIMLSLSLKTLQATVDRDVQTKKVQGLERLASR